MHAEFIHIILSLELGAVIIWYLVKRKICPHGYKRLITPYPKLYLYGTVSFTENSKVKEAFENALNSASIKERLQELMGTLDEHSWHELSTSVQTADFYFLKSERIGRVFGWAQVIGKEDSKLLLGLEPFLQYIDILRYATVSHELAHCAQQIREGALSYEWESDKNLLKWFRIELEAHLFAPSYLILTATFIALHYLFFWWHPIWN